MITSNYRSIRRIAQHVTPGQPWKKSQKELAMITTMSPSTRQASGRRGVVLIVVLAMLGLLAVIGVTFATYSNQAQIASRRFIANTKANVDPDSMLNYALEQLINDSNNRLSSLRGHSLKRDMYGNDSVFHGVVATVPNVNAAGFPKPQLPPMITNVSNQLFQDPVTGIRLARPARLITTNIPVTGTAFDGYDFTRWVLKVSVCRGFDEFGLPLNQSPLFLSQTIEVLNGAYHTSMVSNNYRMLLINEPDQTLGLAQLVNNRDPVTGELLPTGFALDGRYLRSFNGAGVTHSVFPLSTAVPSPSIVKDYGVYPNFRLNQVYLPTTQPQTFNVQYGNPIGMPANPDLMTAPALDEDYDAADLENWFLALQSADGSITLPSFHRPGIIQYDLSTYNSNDMSTWGNYLYNPSYNPDADPAVTPYANDWQRALPKSRIATPADMAYYSKSAAKFLRPRAADGHDRTTFPDLVPDLRPLKNGVANPTYGQVGSFVSDPTTGYPSGNSPDNWIFTPGYDVDNDGDGYRDSVWLDLGLPVQTDANGKKYKPLYAFLVVGLNGRLPLNTAGNLHNSVDFDHTSHLASSPTEVNPRPALRHNKNDQTDPTATPAALRNINSLLGLRGLLTGNQTSSGNVLGRWGDDRLLTATGPNPRAASVSVNKVRAGKSSATATDSSDDDTDVFDFLASTTPDPSAGAVSPQVYSSERSDGTYPTSSRNLLLGVERIRRFVTPIDPMGKGRIIAWNRPPLYYSNFGELNPDIKPQLEDVMNFGRGSDNYGRIGFWNYFRPPGISVPEIPTPSPNIAGTVNISSSMLNPFHGYESFRNPLLTSESILDTSTNTRFFSGGFQARMPYNFGNNWPILGGDPTKPEFAPTTLPYNPLWPNPLKPTPFDQILSFDKSGVGSSLWPAPNKRGTYTGDIATQLNLMNIDEADEQNLYDISDQFDSPFRAIDLADLYLANTTYDDTGSGNAIQSRIAQLAPEGLGFNATPKPDSSIGVSPQIQNYNRWPVNPRKLFSHESWDTNRFSWANDNPGGAYGDSNPPAPFAYGSAFPNDPLNSNLPAMASSANASFDWNQSASLPNLSYTAANRAKRGFDLLQFPMPSIALGDRRINLNFPFPNYDYQSTPSYPRFNEPTRQKWMRETYQLMLSVLPPKAVDTAIEKAQLAQFIVNVVDFRDPDGVMTRFSAIDPNTGGLGHGLYETIATSTTPSIVVEGVPAANSKPLVLWGMEYNPVALNEAMAYEFQYWGADGKAATPTSQRRLFIELVNTLTSSQLGYDSATKDAKYIKAKADYETAKNVNNDPVEMKKAYDLMMSIMTKDHIDPSDQNMNGWELVMTQDTDGSGVADASGRPDPITGQIPTAADNLTILGKVGTQTATRVGVSGVLNSAMPLGKEVKAMRWDEVSNTSFPVYNVLANPPASVPVELQPPDTYVPTNPKAIYNQSIGYDTLLPPVGTVSEAEKGRYFWLYLLRPADPADPVNSPKVVVDSIRFPYMVSDAKQADSMLPTIDETVTNLYSAQRLQPYRGGHSVANSTANPYFPLSAYGFSEQTTVSDARTSSDSNNHSIGYSGGTGKTLVSDRRLRHSIGSSNANREDWSLFQLNDRDFQSVAELLQVPGCGPGQFTKMFIENPPLLGKGRRNPAPPIQPSATADNKSAATAMNYAVALRNEPPTYPYLVDRFYYTGSQQTGYATPMATVTVLPTGSTLSTPPNVLIPDATSGALYGSPSADGWHKMLEFFEVPSSMNGAIGPVTEGENGDWFRQTRVPGKLNLNLIVDEEVFLGLFDDGRVNLNELDSTTDSTPSIAAGIDHSGAPLSYHGQLWKQSNSITPFAGGMWSMPNRGYINDPINRGILSPAPMKRVFSDFLKLRHGGSGTLLAFGSGATGTPIARERPYRSLSYPDINDTIMRPAALPPSAFTVPGFNSTPINTNGVGTPRQNGQFFLHNYQVDTNTGTGDPNILALNPIANGYVNNPPYLGDPGIRNIFTDYSFQYTYAQPPAIPFRRIFQIPDAYVGYDTSATPLKDWDRNSNAGLFGNPMINTTIGHTNLSTSLPYALFNQLDEQTPQKQIYPPASLFVPRDLSLVPPATTAFNNMGVIVNNAVLDPTQLPRPLLGANVYQIPVVTPMGTTYTAQPDRRQHPFFRTELLQKVMNLTTVRTQQFAVYVTVGFFEVKKEGNANTLQPDILGAEIDPNNRYTMFAVVDRSKAEGFNPINPGNFRQLVDYSRRLK